MQPHPAPENNRPRVPACERRANLLSAAIRAFSQKGFCGTKTKHIAAEAGVNEAIIFRHFPTKDDLYAAILESADGEECVASVRDALASSPDPLVALRELVLRMLAWYRGRPELLRLVLFSALERHQLAEVFRDRQVKPILDVLTDFIAAGQESGRFATTVPAAHTARILFGNIAHQGLIILLLRGAEHIMSDDEIARAIAHTTLEGLQKGA